jgi:hypothetical protein
MSKNPSDKKPMPGEDERKSENQPTTEDWNKKQEQHRQGETMARKQEGQKFVSDEDIIKRRTA